MSDIAADQSGVPISYLVTGASRGLGLELTARLLALPSQPVVVAGVRSPQTATALNDLVAQYPGRAHVIKLDTSDKDSIKAAAQWVDEHLGGRLDVLINNAGVGESVLPAWYETDFDAATKVLQTNTLGPLFLSAALLPALKRGNKKQILIISSVAGSINAQLESGKPLIEAKGADAPPAAMIATRFPIYKASKVALNMEVLVMAADLASQGFIVMTLHPGWVATDMGNTGAAEVGKVIGVPEVSASLTTEQSVDGIVKVLLNLEPKHNGAFLQWDGETHPW